MSKAKSADELNLQYNGDRNHLLSKKLRDEGYFFDWSVTTAFYAAEKYIQQRILFTTDFNKKRKNKSIPLPKGDISQAFNILDVKGESIHTKGINYAKENYGAVGTAFKSLYSNADNARYKNCNLTKEHADSAIDDLEFIFQKNYPGESVADRLKTIENEIPQSKASSETQNIQIAASSEIKA